MNRKMECPICKRKALFVGIHDDEGNYHGPMGCEYEEFCKEKRCEWKNHNGICNLPVCMKEVSHADARKSKKD